MSDAIMALDGRLVTAVKLVWLVDTTTPLLVVAHRTVFPLAERATEPPVSPAAPASGVLNKMRDAQNHVVFFLP